MAEPTARLPLWVRVGLPLAILAVALVVGSGAFDASAQSPTQRAAAIEAGLRCPSCADLSVAQSNASSAIAVRHQVEAMVAAGRSTGEIDQVLVSQYGQTILLLPPDSGGIPLIYVVPLVLGAGAVAGIGILFWRRGRAFAALRGAEASR